MRSQEGTCEQRGMVERFLAGELCESEERGFQDHFMLCNECLEEMELAQSFGAAVVQAHASKSATVRKNAWLAPVLALAAAVSLTFNIYLLNRSSQPEALSVYTLNNHRGDSGNEVRIHRPGQWVVFHQPALENLSRRTVVLETVGGERIWQDTVYPTGSFLELTFPESLFKAEDYRLQILADGGTETLATYRFSVRR